MNVGRGPVVDTDIRKVGIYDSDNVKVWESEVVDGTMTWPDSTAGGISKETTAVAVGHAVRRVP